MTALSPTALEEAAKAISVSTGDEPDKLTYAREMQCSGADREPQYRWQYWTEHATAAITAYLAQREKEGWVMVRGTEVDDMRSALKGLSDMYAWTWDKVDGGLMMSSSGVERFEKAHQRAYEVLYPDRPLITDDDEERG